MATKKTPKKNPKMRRATSFGAERANPQSQHCLHGASPSAIRMAVKRLLHVEVDANDPDALKKAAAFCSKGKTVKGQAGFFIAASMVQQAIDGNLAAAREIADATEGRLQDNVNLTGKMDTTIAYKNQPIKDADERDAIIQELIRVADKFRTKPTK